MSGDTKFASLEQFLRHHCSALFPDHPEWRSDPEPTEYVEHVQPEAHPDRGHDWLDAGVPYIWRVGVLARWDSNKADWAQVLIGHERAPGRFELIGTLNWSDGENDDIGRSLTRYGLLLGRLSHPVFHPESIKPRERYDDR